MTSSPSAVERGLARREAEEISFVGLDEKSFLKGKEADAFACVMTDIDNHRILDVARGRTCDGAKDVIEKALNPFQQYMVCGVAMDMSAPFEKAVRKLMPCADVVFDKYHVGAHLNEGFNTTIQALKATAKGYRNFENFRIAILFYCGKLDMRPDFVRVGASC